MKRRATNVVVTKRAAATTSVNSNNNLDNASAGGGQSVGSASGSDKEHVGVVSLVQLERHYGFIEVLDMDERVFFHLSEVVPDGGRVAGEANASARKDGGAVTNVATESDGVAVSSKNSVNKVIIRRGQEVAFQIGQRQGRPLGLRVRKLEAGTLPTEETLPWRFVGVVVVPPRNVGSADNEKVWRV